MLNYLMSSRIYASCSLGKLCFLMVRFSVVVTSVSVAAFYYETVGCQCKNLLASITNHQFMSTTTWLPILEINKGTMW